MLFGITQSQNLENLKLHNLPLTPLNDNHTTKADHPRRKYHIKQGLQITLTDLLNPTKIQHNKVLIQANPPFRAAEIQVKSKQIQVKSHFQGGKKWPQNALQRADNNLI